MNRAHLEAFLWLRWRLIVNQFRHSGAAGVVLSGILTALLVIAAAGALVLGFVIGLVALRTAPATAVMLVWDGTIAAFLFLWFVGLMTELQRTDAISLDRFLHLPVSPSSAFLINFIGSSVSLGLILMLPAMTGLAAGLLLSRGLAMLVLFPLIAAFFLMMMALSYQFRGWLAAMMESPRRRQTIIAIVPLMVIMTTQLPNLWNNLGPGSAARREAREERQRVIAKLDEDLAAGRITREEYRKRRPLSGRSAETTADTARVVNTVAPPGWLAYGAESAANGRVWPALAGALGMALIGSLSLRRAYGTTLRLYRGDFTRGRRLSTSTRAAAARLKSASTSAGGTARPRSRSVAFMEARLPLTSERVSAVAAATLRAWSRAPEMKLTLLTPVFILVVFSRTLTSGATGPELLRPLSTAGLAGFVLIIGMVGPVGNQFGYDRGGFRAFVLSPLPRRDILLGKNLSACPFALAMMLVVVGLSQWFVPMRVEHFVGVLLQLVPMYLVFCLGGNLLSIVSPLTLKPGSGMPVPHQGARNFSHVLFMVLASLAMGLTLLPLGVEALFSYMDWFAAFPAYLVLGALQVLLMVLLYRRAIDWQGDLLHRREQRILEIVAAKAEGQR